MPLVDIALVKKHLRVYHDDENTEITAYQAAAESLVIEYLDRTVYAADEAVPSGDDGTAIEVTPPITAAILLLTERLFDDRGSTPEHDGPAVLSRTERALLAPYRVWRTFDEDAPEVTVQ